MHGSLRSRPSTVAWLVRRCSFCSKRVLATAQLTGTVCLLGAFTMAPTVAVLLSTLQLSRYKTRLTSVSLVFLCSRSVAVVSHRSRHLSRGFRLFFCLLPQVRESCFFSATLLADEKCYLRSAVCVCSLTDLYDSCSIAYSL